MLVIAVGILWVLPIILGVRTARGKNRSPHWMWLGIYPVLAWIPYAVMRSLPVLKTCPHCLEKVHVEARVCPHCTTRIDGSHPKSVQPRLPKHRRGVKR